MTILTALVVLAVGSGGGGIVGAFLMVRKSKMDQAAQVSSADVGRRSTDSEQFKALFPGGLGEAVTVFQEQARDLYEEVSALRERESKNHTENLKLRTELAIVKADLVRAERRIAHLEAERAKP